MSVKKNVPLDYDNLLKEYLYSQKQQEITNQSLYDCKRQLKVSEALQAEYQHEIEALQADHETKISKLLEKITTMKSTFNEKLKFMEHEVVKKDEELANLSNNVPSVKNQKLSNFPGQFGDEDYSNFFIELNNVKEERAQLQEINEELKYKLESVEVQNATLKADVQKLTEDLNNLRESFTCKHSELREANDLIQSLNDDLLCTKSELDSLQNQPLDKASKGNSLFAEVDDRRVHLQNTIRTMKTSYNKMKQERTMHLSQISKLRNENVTLSNRWQADLQEKEEDEMMVLDSYKLCVKTLEESVKDYQKQLQEKSKHFAKGSLEEFEYFEKKLNDKSNEIQDFKEQLMVKALSVTLLAQEIAKADKEKRKWRLEATQHQYQVAILKDKVDELEVKLQEAVKEPVKKEISCLVAEKVVKLEKAQAQIPLNNDRDIKLSGNSTFCEATGENLPPPVVVEDEKEALVGENKLKPAKKVAFADGTVEPQIRTKRGGIMITVPPPIFYDGIPKYK